MNRNNNSTGPREIALTVLSQILEEGGYNNIALKNALSKYNDTDPRDRAMVTELVNGTLRNLIYIDYIIAAHSKAPAKKMFIKNLLRMSVYQLMFMDRVPESAVCNEAVELAKKKGMGGLSGYVNGLLRSIARAKGSIALPDKEKDFEEYLSVVYSHPKWLVKYWLSFMNKTEAESLCAGGNTAPVVTLSVNTTKITAERLINILTAEGVAASYSDHENTLKVKGSGNLQNLESFKAGYYHVMDINAVKAMDLISPKPGERVLDLCASPGGKSFYAAALMKNKGEILSLDIHEHKLKLIEEGAERLGFSITETGRNDAAIFNAAYEDKWNKVILDAPCSGFGVLSKKPDARYKKTMGDVLALAKLQRDMLSAAHKYPKPGGRLLYCTCTISVKENEENISWFLQNYPYEAEGEFRGGALAGTIGDGFYAVSLRRISLEPV